MDLSFHLMLMLYYSLLSVILMSTLDLGLFWLCPSWCDVGLRLWGVLLCFGCMIILSKPCLTVTHSIHTGGTGGIWPVIHFDLARTIDFGHSGLRGLFQMLTHTQKHTRWERVAGHNCTQHTYAVTPSDSHYQFPWMLFVLPHLSCPVVCL